MKGLTIVLALLLALLAAPATGQEARYHTEGETLVHEVSGTVDGTPRVRVETDLGTVRISASRDSTLTYRIRVRAAAGSEAEARRMIDTLEISASRTGDLLLFHGKALVPELVDRLTAEFELSLPRETGTLEILTGAGDVEVHEIDGGVTVITHGGNISAGRIGGSFLAETRGGDITIGRVGGDARLTTAGGEVRIEAADGDLVARTAGGDVHIGRVGGTVTAESGGGSVSVDAASGAVKAGTGGGNIDLGRILGQISAVTAGGSIRVVSAGAGVQCETAAGAIELQEVLGQVRALTSVGDIRVHILSKGAFAESKLQSLLGDVFVSLPDSLPVTIHALVDAPLGVGIDSEFPLAISRELEAAGRPVAFGEGDVLGGGAVLKIRTLGGNIVIRKAKKEVQ